MKEQCMICGSIVEDVSGVCPVCGAALARSRQMDSTDQMENAGDTTTGSPSESQPGNPYGVPNGSQPGNPYGVPNGVQPGVYQGAYNYQNPNGTNSNTPKQKTFAILSLVCSIVSLLTCCVPVLGMILAIAGVIFGILALVKKQVKVPAIIGLIIGVIALFSSFGYLCMNLMFRSIAGTNINGMIEQLMETESAGCMSLEDIVFLNPGDNEYYALYSDGSYETSSYGYGSYNCYNYMDYYMMNDASDAVTYSVVYAMSQGYEIKNITILNMGTRDYIFVVPDDFEPGDTIYYIGNSDSAVDMDSYQLVPVYTMDINDVY